MWQTHELRSDLPGPAGAAAALISGTIIAHHGVAVSVRPDAGLEPRAVKVKRRSGHVVGDRVELLGERLHRLERQTQLRRRDAMGKVHTVAANLDLLGIVLAPVPPSPTGFVDRALIAAESAGLLPLLIINKADLPQAPALVEAMRQTWLEGPGAIEVPIYCVSAASGLGLDALREHFAAGHRGAFVGTSGVGKSSLVNALLPQVELPVGDINQLSGLGRHTTTTATLHQLPGGGELIDTPGFRDFGLVDITVAELALHFPGFAPLLAGQPCRFNDCRHRAEPDCTIKLAVEHGRLAHSRWARYLDLLAETEG